jgi:hypothetical protein
MLISALAEEAGLPMEQARVNRVLGDRAVEAGLGMNDLSAIALLLRKMSGAASSEA